MKGIKYVTGYIVKEETVSPLESNIIKNTFVIDVDHPFPGYYGQAMKDHSKPGTILFITAQKPTWESIIRIGNKINAYMETNYDVTKCRVNIRNQEYHGIRIKGLPTYEDVFPIHRAFQDEGFQMMKKKRLFYNEVALITLAKFFALDEVGDGIYLDSERENMGYARLDNYLNWEMFRNITSKVKNNNLSQLECDVAKGAFFFHKRIVDVVRVFRPNLNMDVLQELKDVYSKEVQRYVKII